ncbi:M24 family metallopeptidase [Consotaella aegiceratis]|uniref:M24 family metallopeptidase n=1 Tax=Consotaella aegiceratis TaxID=3097961 RepID=UPI002F42F126
MRKLASELRHKAFGEVRNDVDLIASSSSVNKAYLSGYVSMAHDTAPLYRSAVLATRNGASLVTSAADAGPASELLSGTGEIYRYGEFYFEALDDSAPPLFDRPSHRSFEDAFKDALLALRPSLGRVGVDRSNDDVLWDLCRTVLGQSVIVDATAALRAARETKLPAEVARIRKAAQLVENGYRRIVEAACHGMNEIELSALVTECMAAGGAIPRFVSVTSGPRSALADAYPTRRVIGRGDTVRIDAGCTVDGYWSDIGRTFVFGEPDARQRTTYDALKFGLEAALAETRAGVEARRLFQTAMATVRGHGIPAYRRQHCGHGIGLNAYDPPTINAIDGTVLRPGMCLCLETPYYVLGLDGMMVEDTVLVTESGYEPITTLSRELLIVS